MDDQAVRLNRIETKLDKLTEAMSMIARVDEKLVAGSARIDRLEYRLDEQESDIDGISLLLAITPRVLRLLSVLFGYLLAPLSVLLCIALGFNYVANTAWTHC